ncbi:MAG: cytochrome c biogenesis protein ResB [Deltaproteobacteria bacterium]|nr:cytochrome c biogenesis protein ResB [Deltaproteobacteria bacterium]
MKSIWRFFASTQLTILLAGLIILDAAWGSIISMRNPQVFQALDQAILFPWLLSVGKAHFSISLWIFILVLFTTIFAVNTTVCTLDKLYSVFKDKRPWQSLFPQIVHIGFLIALLGHLVGSIYGFRSPGNFVFQGQTIPVFSQEGLSLRFDDIEMKTSRRAGLEDLKTKVALLEHGKEILKDDIQINGPLIYKGIAFYHADQGEAPTGLILKVGEEGFRIKFGGVFKTKNGAIFKLGTIIPDFALDETGNPYSRSEEYRNPHQAIISASGKMGWLQLSTIGSSVNLEGRTIELSGYINAPYVVLNINKDPGIWFIIIGSAVLVIGMLLLLFLRGERAELVRQIEN